MMGPYTFPRFLAESAFGVAVMIFLLAVLP